MATEGSVLSEAEEHSNPKGHMEEGKGSCVGHHQLGLGEFGTKATLARLCPRCKTRACGFTHHQRRKSARNTITDEHGAAVNPGDTVVAVPT